MPLTATLTVPDGLLDAMASVAARVPVAAGLNVSDRLAEAPAAIVSGSAGVARVNSAAFVPETDNAETLSAAVPVLFNCTVDAALVAPTGTLPKDTDVGATWSSGCVVVPVPPSATVTFPDGLLEATVSVAAREPVAAGLKVTEMPAVPPAAIVIGSAGTARVKSAAFVPDRVSAETLSAAVPVLFNCTVDVAPAAPTGTLPKETEAGAT